VTLEGPRVLNKTIPFFTGDTVDPSTITLVGGFEDLGAGTYVYRTYFDLSGYNRKSLTAFFQGVDIQEGTFNSTDMGQLNIVDLITTEYMTDAACLQAASPNHATGDAPGFPQSVYDLQQVVYGRRRTWVRTNVNNVTQVTPLFNVATYGTCAAASSDKLYITRVISIPPVFVPAEFFRISPCAFVLALIVAKEDDLPYLMRQKRSFELATGP